MVPESRGAVDGRSSRIPGKNKGARFHVQTRLVFAPWPARMLAGVQFFLNYSAT
jgi:hypothetical protein